MTDWQPYVRQLADALGLKDWSIVVNDDAAEEGSDAQIKCTYGHQRAMLWLNADFDEFVPDKQRVTIAHELIHCHLARLVDAIRHVGPLLGVTATMLFENVARDGEEQAAESLAVVLAPHLPLPTKEAT